MFDINPTNAIGIIGAVIILALFLLQQSGKLKNSSLTYDLGNSLGSLLLVIYAIQINSFPFAVLNVVWLVYSLRDVLNYRNK